MATNNSAYLSEMYKYLFIDLADPRTNDWFLVKHPIPIFLIVGIYVYGVVKIGPNYMKNRKPYELKNTLIIYNFVQVLLSCYLVWEGLDGGWLREYSWRCQPVDYTVNDKSMRAARGCYVYFIAKISELMDTVFFVMRKKNNQVTFLHVYHHSFMPLGTWIGVKYIAGGHGTFVGVLNSFVHIIMYFYYMMSAMGPQFKTYLWWKKYITTLQLVQFCIAFLHTMQLFIYDCDFPKWYTIMVLPNVVFLYYLFSDFYKKSYGQEKTEYSKGSTSKNIRTGVNSKVGHVNRNNNLENDNDNIKVYKSE